MTALAGVTPSHARPDAADRFISASHVAVGLVLGGIGALLVAIGGVGLPVALVTVGQRDVASHATAGAFDGALRVAPLLVAAGIAHLAAAAGLVAGKSCPRSAALVLTSAVAVSGVVLMIASTGAEPLVRVGAQDAATSLAVIGFVVLGHPTALGSVALRRAIG